MSTTDASSASAADKPAQSSVGQDATSASAPSDGPAKGRCPYGFDKAGATTATGQGSGSGAPHPTTSAGSKASKCPVLHGAAAGASASSENVDVHAMDAPKVASDVVKAFITSNYNHVAVNGAAAPSAARVVLAKALQRKLGYTEEDLEYAGKDATLMQGVGYPHQHAQYGPGQTVVDMGCGMGVDTRIAAWRVGPTGRAVGIDLSEGEVMVALKATQAQGLRNVDYRVADMEDMPFENNSVDRIISNGGFCLVPDKPKSFREIYRCLRPGGRIAIACTVRRKELDSSVRWPVCMNTFMLQADIVPVLTRIGFEDVFVDLSNSRMDGQAFADADIEEAAKASGTCSHAIKAQLKARKQHGVTDTPPQPVEQPSDVSRRNTVHKGRPEFSHLRDYDMSDLCARVVIVGTKPAEASKAADTTAPSSTVVQAVAAPSQIVPAAVGGVVAALIITAAVVFSRRR